LKSDVNKLPEIYGEVKFVVLTVQNMEKGWAVGLQTQNEPASSFGR
jgi:hypothetical protein